MSRIIDLTLPVRGGMPVFEAPWHPAVEVSVLGRHKIEGRQTTKLVLGTHSGTHIDAPLHFCEGGAPIDQTDLEALCGPAVVARFPLSKPGTAIEPADLERTLGERPLSRVLIQFDWDRFWGDPQYFSEWPHLTMDACRWLLSKGVQLVGMDTPSPDDPADRRGTSQDSPVHKAFLSAGVTLVEYLCNLRRVEVDAFTLLAMPLRLEGCDGSPARVAALCD